MKNNKIISKKGFLLLLFGAAIMFSSSGWSQQKSNRILVFTKTTEFKHGSIETGTKAIQEAGIRHDFKVDTTSDSSKFGLDNLQRYSAVVFLNTTGDVLNKQQEIAFEKYIQSGGGFAGIHAASATEYEWPWFGKLVGGYFDNHPHIQSAIVNVVDGEHFTTNHLPKKWERQDEWYNFKDLNPDINVLATLDENSYEGGKHGDYHPIAWYHEFDGGRAFYTALGHLKENYAEPVFRNHLVKGILWAAGLENLYQEK